MKTIERACSENSQHDFGNVSIEINYTTRSIKASMYGLITEVKYNLDTKEFDVVANPLGFEDHIWNIHHNIGTKKSKRAFLQLDSVD